MKDKPSHFDFQRRVQWEGEANAGGDRVALTLLVYSTTRNGPSGQGAILWPGLTICCSRGSNFSM